MLETLSLSLAPGTPLDPNFVPPTRPPSALSNASDASFFALYDDPSAAASPAAEAFPNAEALPRRTVFATIRRHGQQCLLCGRREPGELVVVRVLMQHEHEQGHGHGQEGAGDRKAHDPIARLKELGLVPHGYSRDDWTNLMTLCRAHADAYDAGAWRWLPNAALRVQLASAPLPSTSTSHTHPEPDAEGDIAMDDEASHAPREPEPTEQHGTSLATQDGLDAPRAETLVDDGISGDTKNPEIHFEPVELPAFDVLVQRPEAMPPSSSPDVPRTRVWRDWRTLTLNPPVVLGAALALLEAGVLDGVGDADDEVRRVRAECLAVRDHWQRSASAGEGGGESMQE